MEKENIYSTPQAHHLETEVRPKKPSVILIILSILLVLINEFLTLVMMDVRTGSSAYYAGYVAGQLIGVILLPLIVVGLFQIGRGFRNSASRVKIFFWTNVILLIAKFGSLLSMVPADY